MSEPTKKQTKEFDEYECGTSLHGPRPPVPGEESQLSKMTTEGASNSTPNSNSNRTPDSDPTGLSARIDKWQDNFAHLLADKDGVELLLQFVREEAGEGSVNYTRLRFYFAVEGLRQQREDKRIRRLIRAISDEIIRDQIEVPTELRETITGIVQKKIPPNPNVFDELQKSVEAVIAATTYRAFRQSDLFIQFVNEHKKDVDSKPIATTTQTTSCTNISNLDASADGTASICSGMTVELAPLLTSSNLQTLHEDSELNFSEGHNLTKTTTDRPMPKLTANLLLATEKRRLEVRPPGAHGYTVGNKYVSFNASYNPVSRQDSERQSCSSASLTDSEVNSKDGKPYFHRKAMPPEEFRRCFNPQIASQKIPIKPVASEGLKDYIEPVSQSKIKHASYQLDANVLCQKLNNLLKEERNQAQFNKCLTNKLSSAQPRVLPVMEEDDQSILDQHVSRVFSPHLSPGTISPRQLHRQHHRSNEMSTSMPDFVAQNYMRHSKSIPDASSGLLGTTTKKLTHKWPSTNLDSGISLYSDDLPYKIKDMKSTEQLSSDDTLRKSSKDELKKMRKQMALPPSYQSSVMPTSSSHHTNSLPRTIHESNDEYTYAVYTFGDEKIPYRTKIPGKQLTLKHFKEYLPKKGNFRFFFTTSCEDPDNPVIQEEVINDMDVLPLYEGKVMGTLKCD